MVVDTGVLIFAFVFGGVPESAIKKAFSKNEIWISPQLLREYRNTPFELEAEGKITHIQLKALLSGIASFVVNTKIVTPKKSLYICRDKEDNMILECCLSSGADYLVTGDNDLLDLEKTMLKKGLPRLKILSPRDFLEHSE